MKAVENAVSSLDDAVTFTAYLQELGRRHKVRALKPAYLEVRVLPDKMIHCENQFVLVRSVTSNIFSTYSQTETTCVHRFRSDVSVNNLASTIPTGKQCKPYLRILGNFVRNLLELLRLEESLNTLTNMKSRRF